MSVLVLSEQTSARCSTWSPASRRWRTSSRARARRADDPASLPRPPPGPTAMGLMPSHRGGDVPLFAAQGDRGRPRQLAHAGSTRTRARCFCTTASPAQLIACSTPRRSRRSAPPPSRRSRRSCSRARARGPSRSSAPASRALARDRDADRRLDDPDLRIWSRTATTPRRSRSSRTRSSPSRSRRRSTAPTSSAPAPRPASPSSSSSLARARHAHQRRRLVVPTARGAQHADRRRGARSSSTGASRRSTRRATTGSRPPRAGFGPEHIVGELGELLDGHRRGQARDDELTVFKSMGIAVEDLAAAQLCVARARERGVGAEVDF